MTNFKGNVVNRNINEKLNSPESSALGELSSALWGAGVLSERPAFVYPTAPEGSSVARTSAALSGSSASSRWAAFRAPDLLFLF